MTENNDEQKGDKQPAENGGKKKRLSEQLRDDVELEFVKWQGTVGHEGIRRKVLEACWPGGSQIELLQWMVARIEKFQSRIKSAQDNGELHPWIIPYSSAVLFESMFQTCVGVWLTAGQPDAPDKLTPSVKDYVKMQARTFGAMVGS